jgi:apolipoprotein N-acyltransferase
MIVAVFPGIFAAIMAVLLRRFGEAAILAAPFVWVATEFARYWLTGNNWNAIGYSQAFRTQTIQIASVGGHYLVGFPIVLFSAYIVFKGMRLFSGNMGRKDWLLLAVAFLTIVAIFSVSDNLENITRTRSDSTAAVIAIQPNVPMSGLDYEKWRLHRKRHVELAESALAELDEQLTIHRRLTTTVIFPESPMNFMYDEDPEFQAFVHDFARRNNVSVLFNSAEPNHADGKYYNSAVMVGPEGREIGQYDKIYLVPFGEFVPAPIESLVPAFVGSFSQGIEYDLLPLGDANAGVVICFESHFGELTREYTRRGADVIIEMTNDGYLGPTPVLRQHLANAVLRAAETNRPVLRVTNVGITAYITERGEVINPAPSYSEDVRVWHVPESDGSQTLYVRFGDWFAWLCLVVTIVLLAFGRIRQSVSDGVLDNTVGALDNTV